MKANLRHLQTINYILFDEIGLRRGVIRAAKENDVRYAQWRKFLEIQCVDVLSDSDTQGGAEGEGNEESSSEDL